MKRSVTAYNHFLSGKDTLQIAKAMKIEEWQVVKLLDFERNRRYELRMARELIEKDMWRQTNDRKLRQMLDPVSKTLPCGGKVSLPRVRFLEGSAS